MQWTNVVKNSKRLSLWLVASCFAASIILIICLLWFLLNSFTQTSIASARQQAELLTVTLEEIRTLYTQKILPAARKHGIEITHTDNNSDDAIPLPATLSMALGNKIGSLIGGEQSSLYSPYPFPGRKQSALNDDFQKEAWQALVLNPSKPYMHIEQLNNKKVLRYATADIMREGCVNCHNQHPDTPKNDWKIGDVRGVLEVIIPIKNIDTLAAEGFYTGTSLSGLFVICSLFLILICTLGYVLGGFIKLRFHSNELEAVNKKLKLLATYDPLTGIYNRRMLIEHTQHAIDYAKRHDESFSIFYFDLDDFKKINDTSGHQAGDMLLQEVTQRVKSITRESDIFARMGGDEFILLVKDAASSENLTTLARKIIDTFNVDFHIDKQVIRITSSIGISVFPGSGDTPEQLIQKADIAMYEAKKSGRNCHVFYSPQMNAMAGAQLEMEANIRNALKHNEFSLYYQPKIDPKTNTIIGAEALIRWQHPQKGIIPPAEFIPIAEKSDLIIDIGRWLREQTIKQLIVWKDNNFPRLPISINVSAKEFMKSAVLPHLIELFLENDIEQNLLELEINEGVLIQSETRENTDFRIIRGMDVGLAIDNFGTGYCSLGYLKQYPVKTLKIDKSFIDHIVDNEVDASIAKTIIDMAHSLSMAVVAEGVETKEQKDYLLKNNCDNIQGYYYCAALPIEDFEKFVLSYKKSKISPVKSRIAT